MAHKNNRFTQRKVAEENGIPVLVKLLKEKESEELKVEIAYTLGCCILSCKDNHEMLNELAEFNVDLILRLIESQNEANIASIE